MPSVSRMERNADGAIKDPFGKPLAPFIVMDKGESLQELVKNGRVDVFTAAQVLFFFFLPFSAAFEKDYSAGHQRRLTVCLRMRQ